MESLVGSGDAAWTITIVCMFILYFFFFQAEDGIRDLIVTGVQTCALPICGRSAAARRDASGRGHAAGSLRRRGQASEGGRAGRPHGAQEETVVGWIPLTSCVTPLTDRSIRPAPSSRAPRRRCRAMPR